MNKDDFKRIGNHLKKENNKMFNQWPALMSFIKPLHKVLDTPAISSKQSLFQEYALDSKHRAQQRGWSRYGIIIPDLPAPHHFFTFLSIISSSGNDAVESDPFLKTDLGDNAMIVAGTAAKMARHFQSYSTPQNSQSSASNPFFKVGKDITIEGAYPDYHVVVRQSEFKLDIRLKNADQVSWFVQTPMFDHFSLLSYYEGYCHYQGDMQKISGLCAFEYSFCSAFNSSSHRSNQKIPLDFSTYHIISLDKHTQLLLNETHFDGQIVVNKAFLRNLESDHLRLIAEFEVLSYQSRLAVAEDGRIIKLPYQFQWIVKNMEGQIEIRLKGEVDTPMLYGVGDGYVGGYFYEGVYKECVIEGRGYMEYVDRRIEKQA
jgi:hypothetical protein